MSAEETTPSTAAVPAAVATPPAAAPVVATAPAPPTPSGGPPSDWEHFELYRRVIAAIYALPNHFETRLNIEGVPATDLFTLNAPLGASIEESMVECLNSLRELWDPGNKYRLFRFIRQSQTFPDVRFQTDEPTATEKIILGIELKGWFTLAKEGEPSFRYKVTPNACAVADLLVVVPWMFNNVISGAPVLLKPIVAEARFAAEMRNYYWEYGRDSADTPENRKVVPAKHQEPYPDKAAKCSDVPVSDSGKNFGRISRAGIFNVEIESVLKTPAAGIPLAAWHKFIKLFTEKATADSIHDALDDLRGQLEARFKLSDGQQKALTKALSELASAFEAIGEPVAAQAKGKKAKPKAAT